MKQLRTREYRRLSDRKGGTSLDDQGEENAEAAADNGWEMGEPYIDDGISASRYGRKRRDDFELLVDDLRSGPTGRQSRFDADILTLWESSRGSRQVGEWVSLIELCEEKRVRIWVTTHGRLYDPANGRDRKALIDDAVDSEYESYKTHRRVSRTTAKQAQRGRPHGDAPYGLMPVYDSATGKLENWVEDPDRSEVVRQLFERLEQGHSFTGIVAEFRERGYLNRSGRPFTHGHLRDMATMHSYAGLRFHKGVVYQGTWKGLVSTERFWTVYRRITDPSRCTHRGGGARHALTAGLRCSRCDALFSTLFTPGRKPIYKCRNRCFKIQKDPIDDLLIGRPGEPGLILEYLARKDIYDALRAPGGDDATVQALRAQLAQARAELGELRAAKGATLAEVRVLANSLQAKEDEVTELEARERELTLPSSVLSVIAPGADVWESWHRAPVAAQREIVRLVLSPRCLGSLYILPSPKTGRYQEIVGRLEWRRGDAASPPARRP